MRKTQSNIIKKNPLLLLHKKEWP